MRKADRVRINTAETTCEKLRVKLAEARRELETVGKKLAEARAVIARFTSAVERCEEKHGGGAS